MSAPTGVSVLAHDHEIETLISSPTPAWLFKHSTACGTSAAALGQFRAYLRDHPDEPAGMLVIQDHRALSTWVANRLHHSHQSPQLFLLKAGAVQWATSHWGITSEAMAKARGKLFT